MTIRIDRGSGAAPWRQLVDAFERSISRGALLPGDRVPTVRGLAEELDLAPNTVARAYRALEEGGWLEGRGRAGTFVTGSLPARPRGADAALARAADAYLRRAGQLGFDKEAARRALRRAR